MCGKQLIPVQSDLGANQVDHIDRLRTLVCAVCRSARIGIEWPPQRAQREVPMGETGVKRKLAVTLVADVEEYSRLMGADEDATHKTFSAYREIIDGLIARHANGPLCPEWWSAI